MTEVHFTVTELMTAAADALASRFGGAVWVDGEISGCKSGRNNHLYFDLVDRDDKGAVVASVPVALWSRTRTRVEDRLRTSGAVRLEDGVKVRILGPLEIWVAGGRLRMSMQDIDPEFTLEALESERDRVLALMRAEGLLERNRVLPVPTMPTRIGLVTATGSAAEADFLHSLAESGLSWDVVFADSRVQGAGAERTIAAALRSVAAQQVDLVALVRGGGSRLDLSIFDHELIARTIATLGVPVFTGIGHEVDTSVADVVAHTASKTPTACASAIIDIAAAMVEQAESTWREIAVIVTDALADERERLSRHARQAAMGSRGRLTIERHRLTSRLERLRRSSDASIRAALTGLDVFALRTDSVDPVRALARGWSITRTISGAIVRHTDDVAPGDTLVTTLSDGTVTSTVSTEPA
jgi:exodeoxyribonuclease VII large subunit